MLLGLVLLAISTVLPLCLLSMVLWPSRGNDFGGGAMALFATAIGFLIVSPAAAACGLFLIHKFGKSRFLRMVSWITLLPTLVALVCVVSSFIYQMRPVPTYNPQNYQHLIGQHLRDARSELDTKHSVSGSGSGNGVSYRFLSLRGMEIVANPDGIITEVKRGLRD